MPHKMAITFAASAFSDLEAIGAWYRDQQAPDVGARWISEILLQIERFADFPESEAQRMQGDRCP